MNSKTLSFLVIVLLMTMGIKAQDMQRFTIRNINTNRISEFFASDIANDSIHRADKRKVLPIKDYLLGETGHRWSNGRDMITTLYDPEINEVVIYSETPNDPSASFDSLYSIIPNTKLNKLTVKGNSTISITVEKLADYVMLVYRNAQGKPVESFYHLDLEQANNGYWTMPIFYMLAGCYVNEAGNHFVFGLRRPFYNGERYERDPGWFYYSVSEDFSAVNILYGEGRASHGNPAYSDVQMPGAGGAGALMGPMEWQLKINAQGDLIATVVHDEPWVDHWPELGKGEVLLTKEHGPYAGVDGKWPVASMRPLTLEMLNIYPAQALTLMRAEIFARHGDSFSDPETQSYFDKQPWYKKSRKAVVLTDIERFNADLIKQHLATK